MEDDQKSKRNMTKLKIEDVPKIYKCKIEDEHKNRMKDDQKSQNGRLPKNQNGRHPKMSGGKCAREYRVGNPPENVVWKMCRRM